MEGSRTLSTKHQALPFSSSHDLSVSLCSAFCFFLCHEECKIPGEEEVGLRWPSVGVTMHRFTINTQAAWNTAGLMQTPQHLWQWVPRTSLDGKEVLDQPYHHFSFFFTVILRRFRRRNKVKGHWTKNCQTACIVAILTLSCNYFNISSTTKEHI